jgi:hypothetical protein
MVVAEAVMPGSDQRKILAKSTKLILIVANLINLEFVNNVKKIICLTRQKSAIGNNGHKIARNTLISNHIVLSAKLSTKWSKENA